MGGGCNIVLKHDVKEVNFNDPMNVCIGFPSKPVPNDVRYLLVLDVNEVLCDAKHLKCVKRWGPLVLAQQCGNKLVSPHPGVDEFLCMCSTKFDIEIWSSTTLPNLVPLV
jgi:hypothetical protein